MQNIDVQTKLIQLLNCASQETCYCQLMKRSISVSAADTVNPVLQAVRVLLSTSHTASQPRGQCQIILLGEMCENNMLSKSSSDS